MDYDENLAASSIGLRTSPFQGEKEGSIPSAATKLCAKCKCEPRVTYHSYCAKCHSQSVLQSNAKTGYRSQSKSKNSRARKQTYNSEYYRGRYREIHDRLIAYKVENGCKDCGYNAHHAALEFDHLPGYKKVSSPTTLAGRGWNSVLTEIKKCDVVCSNCHSIRTWQRRQQLLKDENSEADCNVDE